MSTSKQFKASNLLAKLFVSYIRSFDHPFKLRIVRNISSILFPNGITFISPFNTFFKLRPNNYLEYHIIYSGSYEPQSLDLVFKLLSDNSSPVFLDIGANFGLYTISCLRIHNLTSYSFEPVAENFIRLKNNFSLNKSGNKLNKLINIGLADDVSLNTISNPVGDNDGTYRVENHDNDSGHLIALTTLDSVIHHYGIQKIDVLKMDVEGYEGKVLEGFKLINTIKPSNIILEFSDYMERVNNTKNDLFDLLISLGYEALLVDGTIYQNSNSIIEDNLWFKLK